MVALLTLVASLALAAPVVVAERVAPGALFARQLDPGFTPGDVPQACLTPCQTFSQTLSGGSCASLSCLCTDAIASGLESCLNCAVKENVPDLNKTVADQAINGFLEACDESGFNVTISGFSGTGSDTTTSGATKPTLSTGASAAGGSAAATSPAATQTSSGGTIAGKSAAVREHSLSIVGAVFAVAMAGLTLL